MVVRLLTVPVSERVGGLFLSPHPATLHLLVGVSDPNIFGRCEAQHKLILLQGLEGDKLGLGIFTFLFGHGPWHRLQWDDIAGVVEVLPAIFTRGTA